MNTQTEYIIIVNDRPFFSVLNKDLIPRLKDEAILRFGPTLKIKVLAQTTVPYDYETSVEDNG